MIKEKSMKEMIDEFMEFFTTISKEESDYIEEILTWHEGRKMAFIFAKTIFEEKG